MKSPLLKYQIGLGILGLLTVVLIVFVVMAASGAKQDNETARAATDIAEKLNSYVDEKSKIPSSLAEAGASDVPSTITYTKLSDQTYKFCVTFKADSNSVDTATVINEAVSGYSPSAYGPDAKPTSNSSYLYISPSHTKGENCQTIEPYFYNFGSSASDLLSKKCETDYADAVTFAEVTSINGSSVTVNDYTSTPSYQFSPQMQVVDYTCQPVELSDIKAGTIVDVYLDAASMVVLLVKEY